LLLFVCEINVRHGFLSQFCCPSSLVTSGLVRSCCFEVESFKSEVSVLYLGHEIDVVWI
jgi:hypothetical protein